MGGTGAAAVLLRRASRFAMTGLLVTGLHTLVALSCLQAGTGPVVANGAGFLVATATSFLINTLWSFSARLRGATLARYLLVNLLMLGLTLVISWLGRGAGLSDVGSIALIAVAVPPLSFTLHNFWTYRGPPQG